MIVNINEDEFNKVIQDQIKAEVRKRIKEMQGDYTSKGFIENFIKEVIWDNIYKLCPDVEEYLKSETEKCIDCAMSDVRKVSKRQLVDEVIDGLLNRLDN